MTESQWISPSQEASSEIEKKLYATIVYESFSKQTKKSREIDMLKVGDMNNKMKAFQNKNKKIKGNR